MSKIFDSIKVSKEVSDSVDETAKILDIIDNYKDDLNSLNLSFSDYYQVTQIIVNVAKKYKDEVYRN